VTEARRVVAIGGSWGGIVAVRSILSSLRLPAETAVAMVLHRQAVRSALADVLGRGSTLPVVEAEDKMPLTPGRVHVAPPDYHLLVERGYLSLSTEEAVKYSRPSIDVLFDSAAAAYGDRAVAVVLTGASDDGTDGARTIRRYGGTVIVQDPATAAQAVMPRSVVQAGLADHLADLDALPATITAVLGRDDEARS
jgi:two-component system, chemotaxis family, protein-glutamate methylesterase/glutaminase